MKEFVLAVKCLIILKGAPLAYVTSRAIRLKAGDCERAPRNADMCYLIRRNVDYQSLCRLATQTVTMWVLLLACYEGTAA
jgi:hypothetical protein